MQNLCLNCGGEIYSKSTPKNIKLNHQVQEMLWTIHECMTCNAQKW